ncbi:HAD family hydrolase [Allostreptomyces psammosilenae]|uniref:FMN phosphatase YigB (HAD superfamily) n=1 Tax=Allostreptomyces psammosilenae TaxID=1892865 RepID=A0A852ZWT1_9ACTN|nr:HAD family hydrolase [Allostreptomyces psammosilenae]NYI06826.1 FMN phosphatase YigB (HAD superfamily) [Allostreptomyces psammosilenae]
MTIRAVVFDVGGTLVREDRYWAGWADWLGVPRHTLSALVGAVVALGRDDADALRTLRPGIDVEAERAAREAAGAGEALTEDDLYPDARPAMARLRAAGLWVGVAGNQTPRAAGLLRQLALPADAVATSGEWGVAKPSGGFFGRVVRWAGVPAEAVLYVGDLPANDATPARAAGLGAAHLRRGPWGHLWGDGVEADHVVDSLTELADLLVRTV